MALNNGHFSRQGQHNNKNRNRNRNRRHSGSGSTHNTGGSGSNRVLDSNGPDVKLRGTAQTIAEKYMQLGRDAQLSGDNVMAESYYQHGEHFYRLWLAAQPVGQPIQFSQRPGEDDFDDEQSDGAEGDDESPVAEAGAEGGELQDAAPGEEPGAGAAQGADGNQQGRPFRQRDNNRDGNGGGRDRSRNKWPRRNDRNFDSGRDGNSEASGERQQAQQPERPVAQEEAAGDSGNWETPSFLTRPVQAAPSDEETIQPEQVERKPRRELRPRRAKEEAAPAADSDAAPPVDTKD